MCAIIAHRVEPTTRGTKKATAVHLSDLVSLYTVMRVVEQGKWNIENMQVQSAVVVVQPFDTRTSRKEVSEVASDNVPPDIYAISAIGITISLAGNPRTNAISNTPSIPRKCPTPSNAEHIELRTVPSEVFMLAKSQMTSPAGAATATARRSTNSTFSFILTSTVLSILGFLYGGISIINGELLPFRIVADKSFVTKSVISTDKHKKPNNIIDEPKVPAEKNIVIIAISSGKPLQTLLPFS